MRDTCITQKYSDFINLNSGHCHNYVEWQKMCFIAFNFSLYLSVITLPCIMTCRNIKIKRNTNPGGCGSLLLSIMSQVHLCFDLYWFRKLLLPCQWFTFSVSFPKTQSLYVASLNPYSDFQLSRTNLMWKKNTLGNTKQCTFSGCKTVTTMVPIYSVLNFFFPTHTE